MSEIDALKQRFQKQNNNIIRVNALYATRIRKLQQHVSLIEVIRVFIEQEASLLEKDLKINRYKVALSNETTQNEAIKLENEEMKTILSSIFHLISTKITTSGVVPSSQKSIPIALAEGNPILCLHSATIPSPSSSTPEKKDLSDLRFTSPLEEKLKKDPQAVAGELKKCKQKYRKSDWKSELASIEESHHELNNDSKKACNATPITTESRKKVVKEETATKIPKSKASLPKTPCHSGTKSNTTPNSEPQKAEQSIKKGQKTPGTQSKDRPKRDFVIKINMGSDEEEHPSESSKNDSSINADLPDMRTRRKTIGSYALPSLKK